MNQQQTIDWLQAQLATNEEVTLKMVRRQVEMTINMSKQQAEIVRQQQEIEDLRLWIKVVFDTFKEEVMLSDNATFHFLVADMLEAAMYAVNAVPLRAPLQAERSK